LRVELRSSYRSGRAEDIFDVEGDFQGVNAEEKEAETARNTTEGQTPVGSPRSTDQHEIVRNETSNAPDASLFL